MDRIAEKLRRGAREEALSSRREGLIGITASGRVISSAVSGSRSESGSHGDTSFLDRVLVNVFMRHLESQQVAKLMSSKSGDTVRKLLMADAYSEHNNNRDLYTRLGEQIPLNTWSVYFSQSLLTRLDGFIMGLYLWKKVSKTNRQHMAEDIFYRYVDLDFGKYRCSIETHDQNLVVLCDGIFRLKPAYKEVSDMREMFRDRISMIRGVLEKYHVDVSDQRLSSLYLLRNVPEFG